MKAAVLQAISGRQCPLKVDSGRGPAGLKAGKTHKRSNKAENEQPIAFVIPA